MGLEARKDKPKAKPEALPKVAMVSLAESQDQHYRRIEEVGERLGDKANRQTKALKRFGANKEEVGTLTESHTRRKLRLKIAVTVRLEMRGEYAFMLKRAFKVKLGKILKLKFQQEVLLEPQKTSAKLYKLKLEANVLGAVLGLEGYQQKEKKKMYFGYTLQKGNLRIVFLGQFTKTPDKTEMSARIKFLALLSPKVKLFADVTLDNPNKPDSLSLKSVEATIGLALPNDQTVALYVDPGNKRFVLNYFGRF